MNTSSLQKMKMAARMSCLPSQILQRSECLKEGWWRRMVATSEKNVQLAFLNDQAKQLKSAWFENLKNLQTLLTNTLNYSLPTSTSLVFAPLTSVFPNELVLVSLAPCHSLNQGCKRFLKRFHASVQQNKTLFDTFSTGFDVQFLSCWLFIKTSLMRSELWQLQSQCNWT